MSFKLINSDFSHIESTSCYCSEESAELIRSYISFLPLSEIHYIGTGDYHYISLFFLERITEDFTLILIDNHPDNQFGAFDENLLSCGSWVEPARKLPHCKKDIWIQDSATAKSLEKEPDIMPVYLSIDLDVLSYDYAHTNWSQGTMTLMQLLQIIQKVKEKYRIIGVDICGGLSPSKGGTEEDNTLNTNTINKIVSILYS